MERGRDAESGGEGHVGLWRGSEICRSICIESALLLNGTHGASAVRALRIGWDKRRKMMRAYFPQYLLLFVPLIIRKRLEDVGMDWS